MSEAKPTPTPAAAPADNLISVFIDGVEARCAPGANIVDVAASIGVEIPHYCYHQKLSVSGNCRMCLVEMGLPGKDRATGKPMLNADVKLAMLKIDAVLPMLSTLAALSTDQRLR